MIQSVSALNTRVCFCKQKDPNRNPVNRKMEQRLAVLNAGGISVASGALTTAIARSYTASWKNAGMFGLGAALITMMFICPRLLYKSGINSYKKEKELDVFSKEKEIQKKLLLDVNDAIDKNYDNLDEKLETYSKTISK